MDRIIYIIIAAVVGALIGSAVLLFIASEFAPVGALAGAGIGAWLQHRKGQTDHTDNTPYEDGDYGSGGGGDDSGGGSDD